MRSATPRRQREVLGSGAVGAVADHHQPRRKRLGDAREDRNDVQNALDRAEVGEVHEQLLIVRGVARAHGGELGGDAHVHVAVDEVADDLDLALDVEGLAGAVAQVAGDGGDAVRLLDAELRDGQVGAVQANQRDVGAVQRGDERQIAAARGLLLRLQHLARQQRGERVRDRVVNVEQVERVELGDLGHARGQRQVVGRMLEQRVVVDIDLVEVDVGFAAVQAERRRRGDEVDFVAARGKLDAELGGDDAAAAVGGVAGDADLAFGSHPMRSGRKNSSRPLDATGFPGDSGRPGHCSHVTPIIASRRVVGLRLLRGQHRQNDQRRADGLGPVAGTGALAMRIGGGAGVGCCLQIP